MQQTGVYNNHSVFYCNFNNAAVIFIYIGNAEVENLF